MSNAEQHTPIPALVGQLVVSAYIFNNEPEAHGVVFRLHDGSDISIEFESEPRLSSKVLQSAAGDGEALLLQTIS